MDPSCLYPCSACCCCWASFKLHSLSKCCHWPHPSFMTSLHRSIQQFVSICESWKYWIAETRFPSLSFLRSKSRRPHCTHGRLLRKEVMGNCSWSTLCRKCGFITVESLEARQQRWYRIRANVSNVMPNFGSGKFKMWGNFSRACEMFAESGGICTLCLRLCAGCVYWFFNYFMFQLFAADGNGFVGFELRFWCLCQCHTRLYLNNTQPVVYFQRLLLKSVHRETVNS